MNASRNQLVIAITVVCAVAATAPGRAQAWPPIAAKPARTRGAAARGSAGAPQARSAVPPARGGSDIPPPAPPNAAAETPTPAPAQILAEDINQIWSGRTLRRGTTTVYIVDAYTGRPILAINPDQPMNPASNTKLVSTATALDVLGPRWRYTTRIYGPTPNAVGVAHGDLYLRGNADPSLTITDVARMARALAARGIRRIDGDVLLGRQRVRDSVGLAVIHITIDAAAVGQPPTVTVEPPSDLYRVNVTAVTTRHHRSRLHVSADEISDQSGDRIDITVSGRIHQGHEGRYRRWLHHRAVFTGHALVTALAGDGVTVTGRVRRETFSAYVDQAIAHDYLPVELARHESLPMGRFLAHILKPSNNFLADRLITTAGGVYEGGRRAMRNGLLAMNAWLRRVGIDPSTMVLDTGSGLSYNTRISARQIVHVLRVATGYASLPAAPSTTSIASRVPSGDGRALYASLALPSPDSLTPKLDRARMQRDFLHSLSIAGVDGTLRHRFRDTGVRGRLRGKTGTLTGIIALSGILSDGTGNAVCFSILTNGNRHAHWRVRRAQGEMVERIYRYLELRRVGRKPVASTAGGTHRRARPGGAGGVLFATLR